MNKEQLDLLKKSVENFNKYREDNPRAYIDFENARMQRWRLNGANLKDANFKNAILTDAHFDSADLSNANLNEADCTNCTFTKAKLNGASLKDANLTMCIFEKASAIKTDFRNARMTRAEFKGAILESADFRDARLINADFTEADLKGAKLKGANLKDAKIDESAIEQKNVDQKQLDGEVESSDSISNFAEQLKNPETKDKAQTKVTIALFILAALITLITQLPGWLRKPASPGIKGVEITDIVEKYEGSQPVVEGTASNQTGKQISRVTFSVSYIGEGSRSSLYVAKVSLDNLQPGEKRQFKAELPKNWKQGMKREIIWIPES
ncbi:MAG: pentapeptide repeat-containing protein [Firmicutes bacterium]|nr:pentapeptide repeat-containing protein [Bacillota bacterium]